MPVLEHAFDPVFCTWTAIHHDVSQEWVQRNARLAADLGFGTWLTDDGWFTDKAACADYGHAGDWEPCITKFPDFAGHVRAVQEMGLRYVLWVAPFMIGDESGAAKRYAHLINTIVSVPMVSVELDRYPQSHLDLIRTWIGFYLAHRDTIVHGAFAPEFHLGRVPLIRFTGKAERIIGLYDDVAFPLGEGPTPLWILNASPHPFVTLLPDGFAGPHTVITRDKFGNVVAQETVTFPTPRLKVEVGGSLEMRR